MTIKATAQLLQLLKSYGVTHYKSLEIEISFGLEPSVAAVMPPKPLTGPQKDIPAQAIPPVQSEIPHHANEVVNLLRLDDESLVDKMFPDYSELQQKGEG